jgi:hypothetical protein
MVTDKKERSVHHRHRLTIFLVILGVVLFLLFLGYPTR